MSTNCCNRLWGIGVLGMLVPLLAACLAEQEVPPAPADLEQRQVAFEELEKQVAFIRGATAAEAVVTRLDHRDYRVRSKAVKRLGELGPAAEVAVPALMRSLSDKHWQVRLDAAMVLGAIGDEQAVDALVACLADRKSNVRLWAWKAIRAIGEKAMPVLISHLSSTSPHKKRYYRNEAGQKVMVPAEIRSRMNSLGPMPVPFLADALDDEDAELGRNAARALGNLEKDASDALPQLTQALKESKDTPQRIHVVRALARIGDLDPSVVPALKEASLSRDKKLANEAKKSLNKVLKSDKKIQKRDKHPSKPKPRPPNSRAKPAT